jgi:ATP-dependent Clp endopeptidase proteolytic subunit ClpP
MAIDKFWSLALDPNDETVLNMYVYGQIKSAATFFGSEDDVIAGEFVRDLNKFPGVSTIHVHINSPGGSVFAAAAIINQLRKHSATVHTWCDGICASAAVGILQAANPGCRHMSKATLLMIHNPSTSLSGDQKAFMKTADLLAKVKQTLVNIYSESTGLPEDQLSQMMDDETYLSAREALDLNFVDSITEDEATYDFRNDGQLICNGITIDVAASMNLDQFKAQLQRVTDNNPDTKKSKGVKSMNFEEFLASLEEPVRAMVQNAIAAQLQDRENAVTNQFEGQLQELRDQLAAAQTPPPSAASSIEDSLPDEAKELLAQARADALAAQQELARIQDAQAFAEFKETFAVYDNLPIKDEHIKAMQILDKNNPELMAELRELFKVANNAMEGHFQAQGSSQGKEVGTTAYDRMSQAIKDFQKDHPEADYSAAMKAVLKDQPDLYDAYRDEMGV